VTARRRRTLIAIREPLFAARADTPALPGQSVGHEDIASVAMSNAVSLCPQSLNDHFTH
jgi:hypothetical protein